MTAVVWEASPGVRLAAEPVHLRLAGAGVALAIGGSGAAVASLVAHVDAIWPGAVAVTILGWWLGPRAVRSPGLAWAAMAILSVLLSSVLVSAWLLVTSPELTGEAMVAGLVELPPIGLLFFGLPGLVATAPSALAWLGIVRWLANRRGSPI